MKFLILGYELRRDLKENKYLRLRICFAPEYPDRAPLKEVLGGQYNYREGGGKCCGKALKAAGGVEVVDVIRIRAPKK